MLTFISLFAGIGGIDLGLERAGMRCVAQVEIDDYCNKVLSKHWPDVPRFPDVRSVGAHNLPSADVIAGGFPCQDISNAGKRAGITGERSGLWSEYARIIGELRPRYVLMENVAALLIRGMGTVLGDLAHIGYDAEWHCLPAAAFGAPHTRSRIFIVAYPHSITSARSGLFDGAGNQATAAQSAEWLSNGAGRRVTDGQGDRRMRWIPNSGVCGTADGLPPRVDRLRGLGNAVVPVAAEFVGRAIVAHVRAL